MMLRGWVKKLVLGKLDIHMQKNETRSLSLTVYKNQLKMDQDLNMKLETMKLLNISRH
jgi:hypothetical protein